MTLPESAAWTIVAVLFLIVFAAGYMVGSRRRARTVATEDRGAAPRDAAGWTDWEGSPFSNWERRERTEYGRDADETFIEWRVAP